jgi:hypothetical protein
MPIPAAIRICSLAVGSGRGEISCAAAQGLGVGASHQTGWSGLAALLLQPRMTKLSHVLPDAASVVATVAEVTAPAMAR